MSDCREIERLRQRVGELEGQLSEEKARNKVRVQVKISEISEGDLEIMKQRMRDQINIAYAEAMRRHGDAE